MVEPDKVDSKQSRSIKLTTRTERSALMFQLQHLAKPLSTQVVKPPKTPAPAGSTQLQPHKKALKSCDIKERKIEDLYVYDFTCEHHIKAKPHQPKRLKRLYYFCGGGWQSPPESEHWMLVAEYARKLPNHAICLVSYPLAPKSAAPVAFPQLLAFYRKVLRDADAAGEEVILAGDSAGANIILALTLHALHEDPESPCPSTLFAMCPSTDLRRNNPDMKAIEKHDPLLRHSFVTQTANAWRAEWDATDPRVSPLLTDVSILAKRGVRVHGMTGGYDILGPDGVLFREKCNDAGVVGEWLHWEKQMHCFPLAFAFKLSESVQAKEWVVDVLGRS